MTKDCPKCGGVMQPVTAALEGDKLVFGCQACLHTINTDGTQFVDASDVGELFKAATGGAEIIDKFLGGEHLSPPARAVLQAEMISYGMDMWRDGLKHGLLLGALKEGRGGEPP